MKLLRTVLIGAVCAAAMCITAFAANIGGGTVNASALNLRSEANTSSSILTVAPRGSSVIVCEQAADGWYRVIYKGQSGYMSAEYISFAETLEASFGTGTIQGTTVRLRDGAGFSSNTLGYYDTGTAMTITGVSGMWYHVDFNGTAGYVSSDYMTVSGGSSATAATTTDSGYTATDTVVRDSSAGQRIVDTAMQYLNVPYVWAGTSPYGFDCSGLVYYVYRENGYAINRTAASIYSNGVYVERSNLQPGDVICFTNGSYSYIGHVGIYIGNNQFIHASSGSGYVRISGLSENYYNNHYYGARRIVQ